MAYESDKGQSRLDVSTRTCVMVVLMALIVGGTVLGICWMSYTSCGCTPAQASKAEPKAAGWLKGLGR